MSIAFEVDEYESTERAAALVADHKTVVRRISRMIEMWRYQENFTLAEICDELNVTEPTARKYLGKLRKIGLVIGERVKGKYRYRLSYDGFRVWLNEFTKKIREPIQKMAG